MAASAVSDDDDLVVLRLIDPSVAGEDLGQVEKTSISISDVESWNIDSILGSLAVQVRANRSRLIEESTYFHGLLGGSFSESHLVYVSIQWNLETIVHVLQFIYGISFSMTYDNFLLLLEAALYFGVGRLLAECEAWFSQMTSVRNQQVPLDTLIEIWNFSSEHGVAFVPGQCQAYLARNFVWATLKSSFTDTPFDLLHSCVEHPQLTVDSEKQLCEALLLWLSKNTTSSQCTHNSSKFDILKKVRVGLLPLEFATGLKRHLSQFADGIISTLLDLLKDFSCSLLDAIAGNKLNNYRFRLTEYSAKIILSGCTHVRVALLFLAVFPLEMDATFTKKMVNTFLKLDRPSLDDFHISLISLRTFQAVHEVDISRCQKLNFVATIMWLLLAFPSLSILRASHCLQIKMEDLYYLIKRFPSIVEVDMAIDISPLVLSKISVLSASTEGHQPSNCLSYRMIEEELLSLNIAKTTLGSSMLSNLSKLTLEGRNDIDDLDLLKISALCGSLCFLNMKGCSTVTDEGISKLISMCFNIQTLILSYTSFGRSSVLTLCSDSILPDDVAKVHDHKVSNTIAFGLQQLHIDGCKDIDQNSIVQLLSHTNMLKILSVKESVLDDDAFAKFAGSSLESLDISETLVSLHSLIPVIRRNPTIRCLKATGCRNLHHFNSSNLAPTVTGNFKDLLDIRSVHLEDMAIGWGFPFLTVEALEPLSRLRGIVIGLGASPGHHVMNALPKVCPLLESVVLNFQVISDEVIRSILECLRSLRVLELNYCLGGLTPYSFHIGMPMLRVLRLQWVTPWMINSDLAILTQNCSNIVELSLSGCKLLDSDSQQIISGGWPGLTLVHLEECGTLTSNGVSFLFDCKAIEDLLLRHNGKGIGRNFIYDAALKLPQLRKIALDLCDACEGGFDSPSHAERCFLSFVKISRCKSQRCGFELQTSKTFKPVHKDTIVLEWTSKYMRTTVVEERI